MYRDFGVGQMGDMGAHTMDLLWNVIDAGGPTAIEVDQEVTDKYDPNITPVRLKASFEHPANNWRGPITVMWYQGGLKPDAPKNYFDVNRIGNGAIFEGTKGTILADFTSRVIIPNNDDGDLTYYKRRGADQLLPLVGGTGQSSQPTPRPAAGRGQARAAQAKNLPSGMTALPSAEVGPNGFPSVQMIDGKVPAALGLPNTSVDAVLEAEKAGQPIPTPEAFQLDWIRACKGQSNNVVNGTSSKTHCDFDYSGTMIEQMLLGLVAHQAGKRLEYDPVTGRVTNVPEANDYLKRKYRPNWTLNG
jgi:hypothetical protein